MILPKKFHLVQVITTQQLANLSENLRICPHCIKKFHIKRIIDSNYKNVSTNIISKVEKLLMCCNKN